MHAQGGCRHRRLGRGRASKVLAFGVAPDRDHASIGNGVDTEIFRPDGPRRRARPRRPSSTPAPCRRWQGADGVRRGHAVASSRDFPPRAWPLLRPGRRGARDPPGDRERLGLTESSTSAAVIPPVEDGALDPRGDAQPGVASIRPSVGYDFAKPTKTYAAAACGTPVVFAGDRRRRRAGRGATASAARSTGSVDAVVEAMRGRAELSRADSAERGRAWRGRRENASIDAVGRTGGGRRRSSDALGGSRVDEHVDDALGRVAVTVGSRSGRSGSRPLDRRGEDARHVEPTRTFQPSSTVSTHSVSGRTVVHGTRSRNASFCSPPESVTTPRLPLTARTSSG